VGSVSRIGRGAHTRTLSPSAGLVPSHSPQTAGGSVSASPPQEAPQPSSNAKSDSQEADTGAETQGETIFGEAVESWGKICSEMAKTSEQEFDNLQRQLNALFADGQNLSKASVGEDEAFACPI
jgi:hypothetical protein